MIMFIMVKIGKESFQLFWYYSHSILFVMFLIPLGCDKTKMVKKRDQTKYYGSLIYLFYSIEYMIIFILVKIGKESFQLFWYYT